MDKIVLIHGDVTIYETNSIPATAKKVCWKKGFVVERGEGVHTHILENECDDFIQKPYSMNELSVKIRGLLSRK